ncbi:hypothetical protein PUN28_015854 [Cardiocondyla obscurior]|uniref:Uncharacterized protein n=1 Tax=Cardiocondyla obscurior TaxID=286306 RepID=A0AAW2ETC6_9HYME
MLERSVGFSKFCSRCLDHWRPTQSHTLLRKGPNSFRVNPRMHLRIPPRWTKALRERAFYWNVFLVSNESYILSERHICLLCPAKLQNKIKLANKKENGKINDENQCSIFDCFLIHRLNISFCDKRCKCPLFRSINTYLACLRKGARLLRPEAKKKKKKKKKVTSGG